MANPAMGGILSGLMDGYRTGRADFRADEMYAAEKARRAKMEQRDDLTFQQGQEDRNYGLTRRPIVDAQNDAAHAAQMTNYGLQQRVSQHNVDRLPVIDAQADAQHALQLDLSRENIAGAKQRRGIAAEQQARQRKEWGREDLQDAVDATRRMIAPAFFAGARSGDWSKLAASWNASPLGRTSPVDAIEQGPDGTITAIVGGKPLFRGNVEAFQGFVAQATDPTQAFADMDARRRVTEDRQYGINPRGSQQDTAVIRETNEVFRRLTPMEGESENDRWNRAYRTVNEKGHTPLEDVHAKVYQQALKSLQENPMASRGMTPEEMSAAAFQAADDYVAKMQQRGIGAIAGQQRGAGVADGSTEQPPARGPAQPGEALRAAPSAGSDQAAGMPPGARQAPDGNWYIPDPSRPGKYLRVN